MENSRLKPINNNNQLIYKSMEKYYPKILEDD